MIPCPLRTREQQADASSLVGNTLVRFHLVCSANAQSVQLAVQLANLSTELCIVLRLDATCDHLDLPL